MRKTLCGVLFVAALGALAVSCNSNTSSNGPQAGKGVVTGIVSDQTTQTPLSGVTISAQSLTAGTQSEVTTSTGAYSFSFNIDSTSTVVLSFHISGWRDTSVVAPIRANATPTVVNVSMARRSQISGGGGSGIAQTIAFLGASPPEIAVKGVGGSETTTLTWEVRDSLGLPVDVSHSIQLTFTIASGPGGGEFLSPTVVTTNTVGQAIMTLSSGTRAGVVQVMATGTVASGTVSTAPVRIVIDGGFPDQAHFTVAAHNYNLPILGTMGVHTPISVLVGDRWSNPVAQNTALYFSSSAGVIQSKVFTNQDGQGSADLISGNPFPLGSHAAPVNGLRPSGDGYHYIAARTVGQAGISVMDSMLVLWSGASIISSFAPTTFNIPNAGSQSFTFTVADALGHPLSAGTTISVIAAIPPPPDPSAPQNQVIVTFGLSGGLVLNDVLVPGPGTTQFNCRLSDGNSALFDTAGTRTTLTVFVSGPNGQATFTIDGLVH
jgi:hypothetical protein